MKPVLVLFLVLLTAASAVCTEPPDSLWSFMQPTLFGDYGYAVEPTTDCGYIVTGAANVYALPSYVWGGYANKIDADGELIWSKTYSGAVNDKIYGAVEVADGFVFAGITSSIGSGNYDFWYLKTNADGDSLWSNTYGGEQNDFVTSILQTSDGGFVLTGYTQSFGIGTPGSPNFWVVKTSINGDSLWSRHYGGIYFDECYSALETADGGLILAGRTSSYGAGSYDFWIVKTNANGDSVWSRTYGTSNSEGCYSIDHAGDGGYVLAGYAVVPEMASSPCFWLVKINADGDTLWTRTYGGTGHDICYSVKRTFDGGYILGGTTISYGAGNVDCWLLKTNSTGDSLWSMTFGGTYQDELAAVRLTPDSSFIIAGTTRSFAYPNNPAMLALKTGYINPRISSITDVGNDQGRQVRVRWHRTSYDACGHDITITGYSVYRRIDQYLLPEVIPARRTLDWPPGEWEFITTVPARGEQRYATVVPTLADSSSEGIYWSVFFISAETTNPLIYFDSAVDSGYSVDNLPPDETVLIAGIESAPGQVTLRWEEVTTGGGGQPEQNGIWYRVYGSSDPEFTPSAENLLTVTETLSYTHPTSGQDRFYFIILVSDDH